MCEKTHEQDPHSFARPDQPALQHMKAVVGVEFMMGTLWVQQTLTFAAPGEVYLDCRGQTITKCSVKYEQGETDPALGSYIKLVVPPSRKVKIYSITSPSALGLQWLSPAQTGSEHPLLYSQFEAINGRSAFIAPDSPNARFTYTLEIRVPKTLRGLAAAGAYKGYRIEGDTRIERWDMKTPVPLYLVAINVGNFVYHQFDERCGAWATPEVIDQAATALASTPKVMAALEKLFGPYLWGTYSTIGLPALGYPFGAMEHPCMTSMNAMLFQDADATTRVTIHEMTHSWFGNLITNRTWGDFWLNEGVTTFGEWLAIREVLGQDAMVMQIVACVAELHKTMAIHIEDGKPGLNCLKTDLVGRNPDDAFSRVPYFKGALFLFEVMNHVGEEAMLKFLRTYIATYQYRSVNTEEFLALMAQELGDDVLEAVDATTWVYEPELPMPMEITSPKAMYISGLAERGAFPANYEWGFQEWTLYLSKMSRNESLDFYADLGERYASVFKVGMLEFEYLRTCLEAPRLPVECVAERVEQFLCSYGRQVYICALYRALCLRGYVQTARSIFDKARPGYHPIGADQVQKILAKFEEAKTV